MAENQEFTGHVGLSDFTSQHNVQYHMTQQRLAKVRTSLPVKIVGVTPGSNPHSFTVDVQPLVNSVDGAGNSQEHGTIFGIPVASNSGGNGAFVCKPKVGDMGLVTVCDRDISSAVAANGQANPGSRRTHDLSDSIYLGGFGNQNNSGSYIVADENGFTIHGSLTITGDVKATGEVIAHTATSGGIHFSTHTHTDPQGGNTGAPIAGS